MGLWVCAPIVIWVFVGCVPMGFYWLWRLDLWVWSYLMALLSVWPWVVGVTVGLAVGRRCYRWFGRGPWVVVVVLGFFLLGLLGSDGGSMSGYNCGLVVGCACVMACRLICGVGLVVLWVVV